MKHLSEAGLEQLLEVEEIGDRIARSLLEYFQNPVHTMMLMELEEAGVQMKLNEEETKLLSDKLTGISVVISGTYRNYSRDQMKNLIEKHGGKTASGVSAKTNYLLAGDKPGPDKVQKAQKLGVRIISEEEFLKLIE